MRKPFDGVFAVSQTFGNKLFLKDDRGIEYDYYAQWSMNGHNGIDYAVPNGTPILAPHKGTVIEATFNGDYGNYVKIENDNEGSVLAHLDSIKVQIGFEVKEGDVIGISDNTGRSTGPHLHWGYFTKPRNRNNGFDGYVDQQPILTPVVKPLYVFKYKVGDMIETSVDIPVGEKPGSQRFEYGKVGIKFPAKIIGIVSGSSEDSYYNIDQKSIGGGTGYIKALTVDTTPQYVPAEPSVKTYSEKEYLALQKERDDALAMLKTEHENYVDIHTKYSSFAALGFEKSDDITNKIKSYDDTIIGLKAQILQQLGQNKKLATIIADKNAEDSTAIEDGIRAIRELKEVKDHLKQIAKAAGTKPDNVFGIIEHISNFKEMIIKVFEKGKKEAIKGMKDKEKQKENKDDKTSINSGFNWLTNLLFGKGVK